jgi:hypothetical protein
MVELLNIKMKELKLDDAQKDLLVQGLKNEKFSKSASLVANQLR